MNEPKPKRLPGRPPKSLYAASFGENIYGAKPALPIPIHSLHRCPTILNPTDPPFLPDVIEAIFLTNGNLHEMSLLLKRKRGVLKTFIEAHIETMDALNEAKDIQLDKAEKELFDQALVFKDTTSLRFILSTLGKERGYAAKVEHSGQDGKPLQFEVTLAESNSVQLGKLNEAQTREILLDDLLKSGINHGEKSDA